MILPTAGDIGQQQWWRIRRTFCRWGYDRRKEWEPAG